MRPRLENVVKSMFFHVPARIRSAGQCTARNAAGFLGHPRVAWVVEGICCRAQQVTNGTLPDACHSRGWSAANRLKRVRACLMLQRTSQAILGGASSSHRRTGGRRARILRAIPQGRLAVEPVTQHQHTSRAAARVHTDPRQALTRNISPKYLNDQRAPVFGSDFRHVEHLQH